jgi:hypothetical protein
VLISAVAGKKASEASVKLKLKLKLHITFGALFCFMYLNVFVTFRGLKKWKWPGPLWNVERPWR